MALSTVKIYANRQSLRVIAHRDGATSSEEKVSDNDRRRDYVPVPNTCRVLEFLTRFARQTRKRE